MIVICSANPDIRKRWRESLSADTSVKECSTVAELYNCLASCSPQVSVVHASLPALQLTQERIVTDFHNTRLLLLSDAPREDEAFQMLRAGVHGYSNTYMTPTLLRDAVATISQGDVWMGERLTHYLAQCLEEDLHDATLSQNAQQISKLTPREKEILTYIAKGASNKEISAAMAISERTVKAHLTSIYEKLGTPDRMHLAVMLNSPSWKHG